MGIKADSGSDSNTHLLNIRLVRLVYISLAQKLETGEMASLALCEANTIIGLATNKTHK